MTNAMTNAMTTDTCPRCGAERLAGATFCEACAHDFSADDAAAGVAPPPPAPAAADQPRTGVAPETAPPGEESPLDVGWTGRTVVGEAAAPLSASPDGATPSPERDGATTGGGA